ncbi:hypothetical protein FGK63_04530 [Ruegeria sediminis]|uniref:Periplasmic protein n=1 Tax=Ruegeria sediminis TaxID=2583820 RepID=A0ABY2X4J8_9RHOB|nr:hypothetical protein [Ruegeria sediminis]TMV10331.1 hypothetical protein FGK63_04530 [Ruegeria sediminis]
MKGFLAKIDPRSGLRYVLLLQLAIAGILVVSDVASLYPSPFQKQVDLPSGPISPGDQRREYRTDRPNPKLLRMDEPPDLPMPENFPGRLEFTEQVVERIGRVLLVSGQIEVGDAQRFVSFLSDMQEKPDLVALHSPGGVVSEALSLGRKIREAELSSGVLAGAVCMSSCPYVLAGGEERIVSLRGIVGMHQHYYEQLRYIPVLFAVEDIQKGQGETMQHLIDMDVDLSLMLFSLNTPPQQIYALIEEELIETRIATAIID